MNVNRKLNFENKKAQHKNMKTLSIKQQHRNRKNRSNIKKRQTQQRKKAFNVMKKRNLAKANTWNPHFLNYLHIYTSCSCTLDTLKFKLK